MLSRLSAQNFLRKTTGVVVGFEPDHDLKVYRTMVLDSRGVAHHFEDDPFCTMTDYIFHLVYDKASDALSDKHHFDRYRPNSAQVYSPNLDMMSSLTQFNSSLFEQHVLPSLKQADKTLKGYAQWYVEAQEERDRVDYEFNLSEVIFRIFRYLRQHPTSLTFGLDQDTTDPISMHQLLGKPTARAVILAAESDPAITMLKMFFPSGDVGTLNGQAYFFTQRFDPFKCIGGVSYSPCIASVEIEHKKRNQQAVTVAATSVVNEADVQEALGIAMQRVCELFDKSVNAMTKGDKDYQRCGCITAFIDEDSPGHLGKSQMTGFGKIISTGNLSDCIMRLAKVVRSKSGRDLAECVHFAAGRLSTMRSNKRISRENGAYIVSEK